MLSFYFFSGNDKGNVKIMYPMGVEKEPYYFKWSNCYLKEGEVKSRLIEQCADNKKLDLFEKILSFGDSPTLI